MTVWVPGVEGGVYKPEVEMLPTVELPPTVPSTSHVTPVFVVPETVAVNCCFCFKVSGARRGRIVTVTAATDESVRLKIVSTRGSLRTAHRMAIRSPPNGLLDEHCWRGLSACPDAVGDHRQTARRG